MSTGMRERPGRTSNSGAAAGAAPDALPIAAVRTVLMGDPAHFSVRGGANPHTRTRWGTRRRVDRARAIEQWRGLRARLEELGVRVVVVPPDPAQPGLVYPANAGFMCETDRPLPAARRHFTLSNLLPTRAGERPHYERVLRTAGFRLGTIDPTRRFEGEADFFPAAGHYLLTHGGIERQRFVPRFGIPPWRRVYGFRSDGRLLGPLSDIVAPVPVLRLELVLEAHYHGDTALCAFGPRREHLLVYRKALSREANAILDEQLGDALVELGEEDAHRYAANAFSVREHDHGTPCLVLPAGVSDRLVGQLRERGIVPVQVDVSEFLKKGGGSVKCMIGDLGPVGAEELAEPAGAA